MYSYILHSVILSLTDTLYSGQSFMWNNLSDNCNIHMRLFDNNPVIISSDTESHPEVFCDSKRLMGKPLEEFFSDYFSLDLDVESVFPESFPLMYPILWEEIQRYCPVRILRQDPFEVMITFMCAQGIGMHLIRRQVSMLARNYGTRVDTVFRDHRLTLYGFPSPLRLAECDPIELSVCTNNNRVRARNIISAARAVAEGKIDFGVLRRKGLPLGDLRSSLCTLSGIGYKIADCIALFGLGRLDAFPIDTHVKQYLSAWFGSETARRPLTPATYLMLDAEARSILNPGLAGYAGHILFHSWRKEVKKLRWF